MEKRVLLMRLMRYFVISFVICGFGATWSAIAQESYAARSEAMMRWAEAELAEVLRELPPGTELPPPSDSAIASSLNLFSSSPLTGNGIQQTATSAVGSPPPAGGTTGQSPPPITIQMPPNPPERYAPAAQWKPPIQMPDPSTIPSPPQAQAPPTQQRPPIQLPNPSGGAVGRPPIQLPAIPLPPHPPEAQAPWRQGG